MRGWHDYLRYGAQQVCSAAGAKQIQSCRPFRAKYRDFAEIISFEKNPAEELIIFTLLMWF